MLQNKAQKKVPIRKCIGCNEHFEKNTLVRVIRTPEGEITIDLVGKKSGRGAYICKNPNCLKKAIKSKRLEAALECSIPEEIYTRLEEEIKGGN